MTFLWDWMQVGFGASLCCVHEPGGLDSVCVCVCVCVTRPLLVVFFSLRL